MKYIIIRNDDIGYFANVRFLLYAQEELYFFPQTYGIIPYTVADSKVYSVNDSSEVNKFLNNGMVYKAVHGIRHDDLNGNFEFWGMHNREYIINSLNEMKDQYLLKSNVFIPPHNYMSDEWYGILNGYGFTIYSKTKRNVISCENKKIIFDESREIECGVIKKEGYYIIPQSVMIKRKNYYENECYFEKLLEKVMEYYQQTDLLVVTIHWWDFLDKGVLDVKYFCAFRQFLHVLYNIGIRGISFEDACKIQTQSYISNHFFDIESE